MTQCSVAIPDHFSLHSIPQECSSHQLRGGSLESRILLIVMCIETGTGLDGSGGGGGGGGGEKEDGRLAIGFKVKSKHHAMKSNISTETTYYMFSSSAGDGNELPYSHCHSL